MDIKGLLGYRICWAVIQALLYFKGDELHGFCSISKMDLESVIERWLFNAQVQIILEFKRVTF